MKRKAWGAEAVGKVSTCPIKRRAPGFSASDWPQLWCFWNIRHWKTDSSVQWRGSKWDSPWNWCLRNSISSLAGERKIDVKDLNIRPLLVCMEVWICFYSRLPVLRKLVWLRCGSADDSGISSESAITEGLAGIWCDTGIFVSHSSMENHAFASKVSLNCCGGPIICNASVADSKGCDQSWACRKETIQRQGQLVWDVWGTT